jgi:hypothetical protein
MTTQQSAQGGIVETMNNKQELHDIKVLGVSENSDGVPEHERKYSRHVQVHQ